MTENTTVKNKSVLEISPYLSEETLYLLLKSIRRTRASNHSIVTPYLLLQSLDQNKNQKEAILQSLETSLDSFNAAFSQTADLNRNQKYRGVVFLDPEIKKALLLGYLLAGNDPQTPNLAKKVSPGHLVTALLLLPALKDFTARLNVNLAERVKLLNKISSAVNTRVNLSGSPTLARNLEDELSRKEIFGREQESLELLRILARQKKHSVVLVGESGVGKKAVVLAAIKKIKNDAALNDLKELNFLSVDIQSLMSTHEEISLAQVLEGEINLKSPAVVVLENVEIFKTKEQVSILSNFLYHLEENTKARFILLVNPLFYSQFLQTDSLVNQNFEKILVTELPQAELLKVLSAVKSSIEKFHKVRIDESLFPDLLSLSKRFIKGEALPQKAVSLLEESASDAAISGLNEVTKEGTLKIISQKSGVPMASLTTSEKERLIHLEEELGRQVIGQAIAIRVVSEAIRRSRAGLKDPRKPIGSFLFLGPTGVGKTELAKALAKTVFDTEKAFVRLDMSEYGEPHTTQRLIGSPPGYVGYEEGGQLTNPVQERPYCLILLDEIEKAHAKVFDVFLQVLDDGRLTDAQGRLADFKNTIIIATSNLAQEEILEGEAISTEEISEKTKENRKEFYEKKILPKLKESFRPEFINRFDEIVVFNALSKEDLKKIAQIKLAEVETRILEKGIRLKIKEETLNSLVEASFDIKFGARPLVRKIREEVENKIASKIIEGNVKDGDTVEI